MKRTMKVGNIIAGLSLCLVAISFAGCPMSRTPEETRKSYITDIETPGGCVFGSNDMLPVKEFILVRLSKYDLIHYDPTYYERHPEKRPNGEDGRAEFNYRELAPKRLEWHAEHFPDKTYNRTEPVSAYRFAIADTLRKMQLITLVDYDEAHPAGSDLADIATLQIASYAEFIRQGYQGDRSKYHEFPMNQINPDDCSLYEPWIKIRLNAAPTKIVSGGKFPFRFIYTTGRGGWESQGGTYSFELTKTITYK